MQGHPDTAFHRLCLGVMGALAVTLVIFTLYLCGVLEWYGPMRDLWEFVALMQQLLQGQWDWAALLEPYGGIHRIFLPKLMFFLDYRYAAGSNRLSLALTLLLHLSACALLLRSVLAGNAFNRFHQKLLACIILLFFFSTTQIYNLIYTSDNQVVLGNSFAVMAAALFYRSLSDRIVNPRWLLLANGVLVLACLSHSSSLMLLPAMVMVLFITRQPIRHLLGQILFAALLLGLYVSGHDPLDRTSATPHELALWQKLLSPILVTLAQADGILRYIGLHLSSPTSREWPLLGITITYLSLMYLASVLWRIWRNQWVIEKQDLFWLTLALYVACIAFITATGRQMFPNSALTDRYQTLVMTYWPALLMLLHRDLLARRPVLFWLSPLLALCLLLPHQYRNAKEMAWLSSRVTVAHSAATVGITDMEIVAATLSHPLLMDNKNLVAAHNDFLREYGLGYFNDEGSEYFLAKDSHTVLDKPVMESSVCSGELLQRETLSPADEAQALRLEGRAQVNGSAPATVLVVDALGEVVGLGRDQRAKGEFRPLALRPWQGTRWIAFVRSPQPLHYPLSIVSTDDEEYCELIKIYP